MMNTNLTQRERVVLQLLREGLRNNEIARKLGVGQVSVAVTKRNIRKKGVEVPVRPPAQPKVKRVPCPTPITGDPCDWFRSNRVYPRLELDNSGCWRAEAWSSRKQEWLFMTEDSPEHSTLGHALRWAAHEAHKILSDDGL